MSREKPAVVAAPRAFALGTFLLLSGCATGMPERYASSVKTVCRTGNETPLNGANIVAALDTHLKVVGKKLERDARYESSGQSKEDFDLFLRKIYSCTPDDFIAAKRSVDTGQRTKGLVSSVRIREEMRDDFSHLLGSIEAAQKARKKTDKARRDDFYLRFRMSDV